MKEAYTKLMMQQHTCEQSDAVFFERLEQATSERRRRNPWKTAAVAACILLLIPATVWATENIFGITKVTQLERPYCNDKPGIGVDIQYENLENLELEAFSSQLQELEEGQVLYYESWQEAERYLGVDLLDNSLLAAEDTKRMTPIDGDKPGQRAHCVGIYRVADGQFFAASIRAGYRHNNVEFIVGAMATAQHPNVDQNIITKYYHGSSMTYLDRNNTQIDTQQYTTRSGIPVLIITATRGQLNEFDDGLIDCTAYFAVNNISYTVSYSGGSFSSLNSDLWADQVVGVIKEVLEGFTLE